MRHLLAGLLAATALASLVTDDEQSSAAAGVTSGLIGSVSADGPGKPAAVAPFSDGAVSLATTGVVRWEPLGGQLDGAPAVASWAPGRLDVFAKGTDGQLWHRWYDGRWSVWEPLGGHIDGAPAAASWAPGRLDVFAKGTDGQLWHRWYDGRWSVWEPLGGHIDGAPAAASWAPGRLDVFAKGTDGQLWHRWYDGQWSVWEPLGGHIDGAPAAASWAPGRLDVFAKGTDGQLWHRWYDGQWSVWEPLGGHIDGAPAAASWAPGRLDVFAMATDGQLWHRWYDGQWSVWEPLGGHIDGAPAAASWAPGRLDVFANGTDRQLTHTWYDGRWAQPYALSVVVDGTGNGHGRGLSQWGSFGWAVNYGQTWEQILAHYYGGTVLGATANSPIRVRLLALDDAASTGVVSVSGTAMWNGVGYAALEAWEVGPNVYEIWGSSTPRCPGAPEGWVYLQTVNGPVTFTTPWDETTTAAGDVLGVCRPDGSVVHYRGSITALNDGSGGANRTVNEVLVENYLRGVVPREVPASWGNAGNGAGMHALGAQAVAARSFGLSQNRYLYAKTCDSSTCQVYGGAAFRANVTAPLSGAACEAGNPTRECANTNTAIAQTAGTVVRWPDGRITSTEFSASNGPRTAGGVFPPVDDPADDVSGNQFHRWTRQVDAAAVASRYGLGELLAAVTERDPSSPYNGIWGNRLVLQGSARAVTVSALDFRNAFGLPSHGFVIREIIYGG